MNELSQSKIKTFPVIYDKEIKGCMVTQNQHCKSQINKSKNKQKMENKQKTIALLPTKKCKFIINRLSNMALNIEFCDNDREEKTKQAVVDTHTKITCMYVGGKEISKNGKEYIMVCKEDYNQIISDFQTKTGIGIDINSCKLVSKSFIETLLKVEDSRHYKSMDDDDCFMLSNMLFFANPTDVALGMVLVPVVDGVNMVEIIENKLHKISSQELIGDVDVKEDVIEDLDTDICTECGMKETCKYFPTEDGHCVHGDDDCYYGGDVDEADEEEDQSESDFFNEFLKAVVRINKALNGTSDGDECDECCKTCPCYEECEKISTEKDEETDLISPCEDFLSKTWEEMSEETQAFHHSLKHSLEPFQPSNVKNQENVSVYIANMITRLDMIVTYFDVNGGTKTKEFVKSKMMLNLLKEIL